MQEVGRHVEAERLAMVYNLPQIANGRYLPSRDYIADHVESPNRSRKAAGAVNNRLLTTASVGGQATKLVANGAMPSDSAVVRPVAPRVHSDEKNTAKDDGENENQDHIN